MNSKSAPITISSPELRTKVEEGLGAQLPDKLWQRADEYARRKLDGCRERDPDVAYYDNEYLVLLTMDTARELAFSDYTFSLSIAMMAPDYTRQNEKI